MQREMATIERTCVPPRCPWDTSTLERNEAAMPAFERQSGLIKGGLQTGHAAESNETGIRVGTRGGGNGTVAVNGFSTCDRA